MMQSRLCKPRELLQYCSGIYANLEFYADAEPSTTLSDTVDSCHISNSKFAPVIHPFLPLLGTHTDMLSK